MGKRPSKFEPVGHFGVTENRAVLWVCGWRPPRNRGKYIDWWVTLQCEEVMVTSIGTEHVLHTPKVHQLEDDEG